MNLDQIIDDVRNMLESFLHVDWLSTAITVVLAAVVTALISGAVTRLLRKLLSMDKNPLPSSSIFVNLARVAVWSIGLCVVLSSCFNVDVSAAITALGIGGIAISLGFQGTLSNLIGGLQISLTRLVEPGDHIKVGSNEGIVHDVTWRHTSIITTKGERVIIPNSVLNAEALIKMPPRNDIRIEIVVPPSDETLDHRATKIEQAVDKAVNSFTLLEESARVEFYSVTEHGYKGVLSFAVGEGVRSSQVKDVALKAIAAYATRAKHSSGHESVAQVLKEKSRERREHKVALRKKEAARKMADKRRESRKRS